MAPVRKHILERALNEMLNTDLVSVYNQASDIKVTKFSDHTTAVRRTLNLLESRGLDVHLTDKGWVVVDADKRPQEGDGRTIRVLVRENPKARGSKSEARFALYRDGMKLGEYIAAVKEIGVTRRRAIRDIFWDREHGYIRLE